MYPRNAASPPRIAVGPVVKISDGAVQTTGVSVVVQPEGGAESAGGGTVAYSTAAGSVLYTPTQAETNYTAFVVTAYKANCIPASTTIVTSANATAGKVQVGGMDADTLNASALAADAVTEIQNGLSTFDHTTHEVTTDAASRTASQATGFATPANVSDAQTAIINAVNAVNTGAARYISIATSAGYELPNSGTAVYPVEVRTFDGDGNPVALDAAANPTITVTRTADAADLSANLSAISNPATGVYRCTFTVTTGTDVVGPLQIDASGAIATVTRSTSSYPVITDATAVDFTATDRANLAAILEDTGTTLPAQITLAQNDLDILTGTDGATLSTASTTAIGTGFLSTALTKGTAGTIERAFWQILKTQAVTDGTAVADASNTTTTFYTDLTTADGVYDHMIILFTSNGLEGEARPIDTYVQTNGVITLQEPLTTAPTGDEEFIILPQHAHPISEIQDGLATSTALQTAQDDLDILTGTDGVTLATLQPNFAPATAVSVRQEMDNNSTKLASLVGYFSGITSLASWLGVLAGKTADSSTLTEIQATTAGATYDNASDSLQALRDRGDVAWSGAGGSVNITPLSAGVEQRVNGTNITLYLNEVKATTISITDSAGTAIDLSALTLELAIEDHAGTDIQVIADADITISGDSSNNATFTNTAAVTASERVLHWALRDITTGSEVLARGLINVKRAADGD